MVQPEGVGKNRDGSYYYARISTSAGPQFLSSMQDLMWNFKTEGAAIREAARQARVLGSTYYDVWLSDGHGNSHMVWTSAYGKRRAKE